MSKYIDTIQIVFGVLTPFLVLLLLVFFYQLTILAIVRSKERTERIKLKPGFEVRIHEVPNPKMLGVEISKDGEVLQDVGVWKS